MTREADTVTELQESIDQLEADVRELRERLHEAEARAEAAVRDAEQAKEMLIEERAKHEDALIREVVVFTCACVLFACMYAWYVRLFMYAFVWLYVCIMVRE